MKIKIVADSSANMFALEGVDFQSVPLTISTAEREFVDTEELDVAAMVDYLSKYKGKSGTSCPNVSDWLAAFEDYDVIFCVTIISVLSGSYNAAMTAKRQYEEENPGKRVFVLDSFSTGPEMKFHVEKCRDMILEGKDFDTISRELQNYKDTQTSLIFCLESMSNLANNGRVKPAVAKIANILGIRVVGDACEEGLHPTNKCRGEKKAIGEIVQNMKRMGYKGGRVKIDHCFNDGAADKLKNAILADFPQAEVMIDETRGLCSFYAEKGGLIIGFELV